MKKVMTIVLVIILALPILSNLAKAENEIEKITLNGSTSMEKLVNALKESIQDKYPELQLEPQFTGSSSGIQAALTKNADIGNSSRALDQEEKQKGVVENIVAIDAIVVVTDKNNPVTNLSKAQLIDIYKGKIRNWKEVGGKDQPIVVIGREAGSGTRSAFEELLGIEDQCYYANELNETGPVMAKASSIPGAIGYVSLDVVDDSVKTLKIENVEATEKTIRDGSYLLQRPFVMATNGTIEQQKESVQQVFRYIYSEEGQKIIQSVGLISPIE